MTTWDQRMRHYWRAGWRKAAEGGRQVREAIQHGAQEFRKAGARVAQKVIRVQRSAELPERLMQRSAWSVLGERRGPEPSGDWLAGYAEVAGREGLLGFRFAEGEADNPEAHADGPEAA